MKITLPGDPVCQLRMKFAVRGGFARCYDPRQKIKVLIKSMVKEAWHDKPHFLHPRVSFIFHMPIPKSTPKKLLPIFSSGLLKHEKKPDTDNLAKLYLDCMTGTCFEADEKVQLGFAIKLYHPSPKTIIIVDELTPHLTPQEVDPHMWQLLSLESDKHSSCETHSLHDCENLDDSIHLQFPDNLIPPQTIVS